MTNFTDVPIDLSAFTQSRQTLRFQVLKLDNTPFDLTGYVGYFIVKSREEHRDTQNAIYLDTESATEGVITDTSNGIFEVYLKPANTNIKPGTYVWGVGVINSGDSTLKYPVNRGNITFYDPILKGTLNPA